MQIPWKCEFLSDILAELCAGEDQLYAVAMYSRVCVHNPILNGVKFMTVCHQSM